MLSDERIEAIQELCTGPYTNSLSVLDFAHAIERESTAPLLEQIKEDEALMRQAMDQLDELREVAVTATRGLHENHLACRNALETIDALRQRLEAKT